MGRFDGLRSKDSDVNGRLPEPGFNLNQLNSLFARNGLTQTEMIALSGNAPLGLHFLIKWCWSNYNSKQMLS